MAMRIRGPTEFRLCYGSYVLKTLYSSCFLKWMISRSLTFEDCRIEWNGDITRMNLNRSHLLIPSFAWTDLLGFRSTGIPFFAWAALLGFRLTGCTFFIFISLIFSRAFFIIFFLVRRDALFCLDLLFFVQRVSLCEVFFNCIWVDRGRESFTIHGC